MARESITIEIMSKRFGLLKLDKDLILKTEGDGNKLVKPSRKRHRFEYKDSENGLMIKVDEDWCYVDSEIFICD